MIKTQEIVRKVGKVSVVKKIILDKKHGMMYNKWEK